MANTITNVLPKLLAQGVMALRENAVMSMLVNRSYSDLAMQRGNAINIPIPSAITATNVTPSITMASNVDSSPTVAVVTLDFWKEASFQLSDSDLENCFNGFIPMQASAAIKALANAVDTFIIGKHTGIFGITGTSGTTPFSGSLTVAANARALLNRQLAPLGDRRAVIDPDAEANLLQNTQVLNPYGSDKNAEAGIISGTVGQKLGVDWYMNQNVSTTYTPGTAWTTGWSFDGSGAVGATSAALNFASSGTVKVGDIFSLTTTGLGYVITSASTQVTSTTQTYSFYPPLRSAVVTASAIIIVGTGTAYLPNLMFHRDAFAWASRPLQDVMGLGNTFESYVDPVTGIALRLEMSRQYKQTTFSYDILGGGALIRPELAVKMKG